MMTVEGTVIGLYESDEKTARSGEKFTTWTLQVYGGGEQPYYLDLPKAIDRSSLPRAGEPIRAAVAVRPYPSTTSRSGASYSLALRAVLPSSLAPSGL